MIATAKFSKIHKMAIKWTQKYILNKEIATVKLKACGIETAKTLEKH
jgi:hypothetical protein